jgi:hypothetical protein
MAKKEEQEEVEEQDEEQELGEEEKEQEEEGISINITEATVSIEVPRDGNEGETLARLGKMVDGLA